MPSYWLMKSEPDEFSIDDLAKAPKKTTAWFGVRTYQARTCMRAHTRGGDGVLFYHSSCPEPGIAGIAQVASAPYPDATQFDSRSEYYDAASKREAPRWMLVDVKLVKKTPLLALDEMRTMPARADMVTLRRGNRLSITPVTAAEWKAVLKRLQA